MAVTAAAMAIVSAGAQYKSNQRQEMASREQRNAQKKANQIEQRKAFIASQRERQRASAELALSNSMNIAGSIATGGGTLSSSALGAMAGNRSDLGSSIGYQNTMLAANVASATALQRGADRAAGLMASGNNWSAFSNLAATASMYAMPK